jgi:hypothetical protein
MMINKEVDFSKLPNHVYNIDDTKVALFPSMKNILDIISIGEIVVSCGNMMRPIIVDPSRQK